MKSRTVSLIGGGTRSGKSTFAIRLGLSLGRRRAFVATATASDDEMRARIDRHIRDRADRFSTFEEPLALPESLQRLASQYDVVVVDCVSHWLSNLLVRGDAIDRILGEVDRVVAVLSERRCHVVLVSNEVGMSVHPDTPLGRAFVEVSGWANQRLAREADSTYLAVMGTVMRVPRTALPR